MARELWILGAGGLARETQQLVRILTDYVDWGVRMIDRKEEDESRSSVAALSTAPELVLGVGIPHVRAQIWERWQGTPCDWPTLTHPLADVGDSTVVGHGSMICSGVVTTCDIVIGEGVLLNWNVTVGHDATIGDHCVVNPLSSISGGVALGRRVLVGTGANVLEGVSVGDDATIGAGAVVTRDVPPGEVWVGVPAKAMHA